MSNFLSRALLLLAIWSPAIRHCCASETGPNFGCIVGDGHGPYYIVVQRLGGLVYEEPIGPAVLMVVQSDNGEPRVAGVRYTEFTEMPHIHAPPVFVVSSPCEPFGDDEVVCEIQLGLCPDVVCVDGETGMFAFIEGFNHISFQTDKGTVPRLICGDRAGRILYSESVFTLFDDDIDAQAILEGMSESPFLFDTVIGFVNGKLMVVTDVDSSAFFQSKRAVRWIDPEGWSVEQRGHTETVDAIIQADVHDGLKAEMLQLWQYSIEYDPVRMQEMLDGNESELARSLLPYVERELEAQSN